MQPPFGVDDETFRAAVQPYSDAVRDLAVAARDIYEGQSFTPSAESQAMREIAEQGSLAGPWDPQPIDTCGSQISLLLVAGDDGMRTFAEAIVGDHTPLFSYAVLGRFALETLSLAQWLSDPEITVRERVRRSLNERLHNEHQWRQLPDGARAREDQSPRLLKAGDQLGFKVLKPRRDGAVYFDPSRPTISAQVRRGLGRGQLGRLLYSYFSAIAHGTQWGLTSRLDADLAKHPDRSVTEAPLMISADDIGTVATAMVMVQVRTMGRVMRRMGWTDTPAFAAAREQAFQAIDRLTGSETEADVVDPEPVPSPLWTPPSGLWVPLMPGG